MVIKYDHPGFRSRGDKRVKSPTGHGVGEKTWRRDRDFGLERVCGVESEE
jgi:hypothetical protein